MAGKRVTLKDIARHLGVSTATVSRALAGSPQADALSAETRERVRRTAAELGYRPNYLARSLRGQRTFSVGVLVPEISEGYAAGVMSGVEARLAADGYVYLMVSHRSRPDLLDGYIDLLEDRGVEGLLLIGAELAAAPQVPAVVVSGHRRTPGVTRVVLDHDAAARSALGHLKELGHERIAFFRGRPGNVDSDDRFRGILRAAGELGLEVCPELVLELRAEAYGEAFEAEGGYGEGYDYGRRLLEHRGRFTALFAWNDISAIGALSAFQDAGLDVPGDVSVVGFDDIPSAAFHRPTLTTVHQPLHEMGEAAARLLVARLAGDGDVRSVTMTPKLVVRGSTGSAATGPVATGPAALRRPRPCASEPLAAPAPLEETAAPSPARRPRGKRTTLKDIARHLDLSPATISIVLNKSPLADALAPETRERVWKTAREMSYRPNYLARSLRGKRTFSVGVLVPEISEGYAAGVVSGVEVRLREEGYSYVMVSHRSRRPDGTFELLQDRGAEGLILIAAEPEAPPPLPAVVVSGHRPVAGVTNVVIDHDAAARLALGHLVDLGHERVAFFRGREGNVDAEDRWRAIVEAAGELGLAIRPELVLELSGEAYGETFSPDSGYQEGWAYGRELLDRDRAFTALFAWNDISAIGALKAFQEAGLEVPTDVSVVGFDDIRSAAFHRPGLTTVHQPLHDMGEKATRILLDRLSGKRPPPEGADFVVMEPRLVVRGSTGPAP